MLYYVYIYTYQPKSTKYHRSGMPLRCFSSNNLELDMLEAHGKSEAEGIVEQTLQYLVGGIPTPLKNISQLGWLFPIKRKHIKCSKPPTRYMLCQNNPVLFCLIFDDFWRSHHWHSTHNQFKIDRRNKEFRRKLKSLNKTEES